MIHPRIRKRPRDPSSRSTTRSNVWRVLLTLMATLSASQNTEVLGFIYPSQRALMRPHADLEPLFAQSPHRRRPSMPSTKRDPTASSANSRNQPNQPPPPRKRKRRRNTFKVMFDRLKKYHETNGHCLVSAEDEDAELYKWTRSIRKNYRHQFTKQVRPKKESRRQKSSKKGNHKTRRPMLSDARAQMLQSIDFCWDVQAAVWEQKYQQLVEYYTTYGHDPIHAEDPNLAIWLQNQRREYRLWLQDLPSQLIPERLDKLDELGVFEDYKTQREAWAQHYQYLVEFHQKYRHSNVPQKYHHQVVINVVDADQQIQQRHAIFALGHWCMNQRTARRRWQALQDEESQSNHNGKTAKAKTKKKYKKKKESSDEKIITAERIGLLDALDFCWSVREARWDMLLKRLQSYYRTHGHLKISTSDHANQDLRNWLIFQRYYYNRKREKAQPAPITEERIASMEQAIPDFSWKARVNGGGPSTEDWSNLFSAMRDKGIAPEARPKQHWFEGINPLSMEVKSEWTEQELVDLWNQEGGDDGDDDGFDDKDGMFANGGDSMDYFVDLEGATEDPKTFALPKEKASAAQQTAKAETAR